MGNMWRKDREFEQETKVIIETFKHLWNPVWWDVYTKLLLLKGVHRKHAGQRTTRQTRQLSKQGPQLDHKVLEMNY